MFVVAFGILGGMAWIIAQLEGSIGRWRARRANA